MSPNHVTTSAVLLLVVVLGCKPAVPTTPENSELEPQSAQPIQPDAAGVLDQPEPPAGSWTYHSDEHGFSFRFPSAKWKEHQEKQHLADFYSYFLGSPMLVAVAKVKKESRDQFLASAKELRNSFRAPDLLEKPKFEDGSTRSGNPYCFATLCEKGKAGQETYIYVGESVTWVEKKGVTITTLFEGQARMKSEFFKSIEYIEFEKTARQICLSVE